MKAAYSAVVLREAPLSSNAVGQLFSTVPNKGAMVWRLIGSGWRDVFLSYS